MPITIPQDVAEAAERLTNLDAGERPASVYGDLYLWEQKRDEDRKLLANEYRSIIASHRAAEEEGRKPVTEEYLRSVGFREWKCADEEDKSYELWIPMAEELGWEVRLAYQSNGFYAVRMIDFSDEAVDGVAESVELLGTRNKFPTVTIAAFHRLAAALAIPLKGETK